MRDKSVLATALILMLLTVALGGAMTALRQCTAPQPRPAWSTPSAQVYRIYIPLTIVPRGLHGKGVASTDNGAWQTELGATWWYKWTWCDAPGCIPMSRDWSSPPSCPPILMLGNEPNSIEPWGATTSPETAAIRSQLIRAQCPQTWLVAGNVANIWHGMSGAEWIARYLAAGGIADQIGAHAYISPNGNISQAMWIEALKVHNIPICVTEVGSANSDMAVFVAALKYAGSYGCFAAFTDKSPPSPDYPDFNLIGDDDERTPRGDAFERFQVERFQ